MQGIQHFHYKALQHYLKKLKEEKADEGPELTNLISVHEQRLEDIYCSYQAAIVKVAGIIEEFENHKRSVRRLLKENKSSKRTSVKRLAPKSRV